MFREFVVAKRRAIRERDRDATVAWNTAALTALASVGKIPELHTLLLQKHEPRVQTMTEQRTALEALSKQIGVPLRKAKKLRLVKGG